MTRDGRPRDLTDDALQDEIELVGEVLVAAGASERQLTDEEIDLALGVRCQPETHDGRPEPAHKPVRRHPSKLQS